MEPALSGDGSLGANVVRTNAPGLGERMVVGELGQGSQQGRSHDGTPNLDLPPAIADCEAMPHVRTISPSDGRVQHQDSRAAGWFSTNSAR